MGRFRNRAVAGSWQRWRQLYDEMQELKVTLARGLHFWVQGALARSLERWTVFVQESVQKRRWGKESHRKISFLRVW